MFIVGRRSRCGLYRIDHFNDFTFQPSPPTGRIFLYGEDMPGPIVVSDLVVKPGFGQNFLTWSYNDPNWNGIEQLRLDAVEVWAATRILDA
jgi:hypothetical protein